MAKMGYLIPSSLKLLRLCEFLKPVNLVPQLSSSYLIIKRNLIVRKRFYNSVHISQNNGLFEISLDKRKLKTPLGNVLQVPSEALAVGVATEWNSQKDILCLQEMHLTSLCSTALDNPMKLEKGSIVTALMEYLYNDTLCFRQSEPEELFKVQKRKWDPLLQWAENRFNVKIPSTVNLQGPETSQQTKDTFQRHLSSYKLPALIGFQYAVEAVKSLILTLAAVERHLSIDEAVRLSRLETEFQIKQWGNVDWAHDVDHMNLTSRFAAAVLYIHLNSESSLFFKKVERE